jgi:hypothetical protein
MVEILPYQFEPVYNPGESLEGENSGSSDEEYVDRSWRKNDAYLSWCLCEKCGRMEQEKECLCCHEISNVKSALQDSGFSCITDHPQFQTVCLDTTVLKTALVGMVEMGFQPVPADPIPSRYVFTKNNYCCNTEHCMSLLFSMN